ncbi:MAG: tyrosine-type recombinase/integrase [Candidatus Bathyarchaeales archaeon]
MAEAGAEGKGLLPQKPPESGLPIHLKRVKPEGKSGSASSLPAQPPRQPQQQNASTTDTPISAVGPSLSCPECGSTRLYRDGLRYQLADGSTVQRWLCRNCGFRFTDPSKVSKTKNSHTYENGAHQKAAKLLVEAEKQCEKREAGATETTQQADVKGKIVEYCFHMQKQGYSVFTIHLHRNALKILAERGADLLNPDSVKEVIAKQKWSENRRRNVINAYDSFAKHVGLTWEKPYCKARTQKLPFIPTEAELDTLIAGSNRKLACFLELLKETAMRCGEAKRLKWTDIDFERGVIRLNEPEKGSLPRMWKVSQKLIGMLNHLPRKSQKVFGDGPINSLKTMFLRTRKTLAFKLQNPRLLNISFHTFRHWRATMLYHQTKDIYYVKQFLGHKEIRNTEIYINIERTLFEPSGNDEFIVKVAQTPEEVKTLLELGFDYVCQKDGLIFLRKRK